MKLHVVSLLLLFGCASLRYDRPDSGYRLEAQLGVKGCIRLELDPRSQEVRSILVEHDGMSSAFAGTIRAIAGAASSVFGGEREEQGKPQAGEGCASSPSGPLEQRPILGEIYAPPSPREVFP